MTPTCRKLLVAAAACMPLLAAAAWPDRPIRMIVPYSAGGGADNTARVIAQHLSTTLGQQVVIDNRPGAAGVIGEEAVAKATPDGYTVLYDASAFAVNPSLRKLSFDPLKDFIPISLVATAANILVVPPNAPYKSIKEFLSYAKAHPGKLTFASAGAGSGSHLAGEMLNAKAGIDLMHVPYKGGAPALTDVMGNQVSAYFGNVASTLNYASTGKLRALAVTSLKRNAGLPDTPTLAESGLPDFEVLEWNGIFVPRGTSPEIVQRLAKEVQAAVADPKVQDKLRQLGLEPVGNSPQQFSKFVQTEAARWGALVKARHINAE
ncbi:MULTISPECIES: Bug family tripartite tricarboxylate transporter substrate binding protein [unclassified Cupriavidus]|uniref:Bug family tripartite tricarboxylate transporter substrate binding protein n=1 Tax=unclassified Cupriavidus TaxID=2640874 RepID=UPI000886933C|nr:tripartite tricarboxylate transporter substrate binding protein [Cupriavidus sp. YR651]SDD02955.1 Tripartite-type tricarboxylate transporter, receptor component TctC [Cupriavidus sp. YR651]